MISVNGVSIAEEAVAREMQQHPAPSREEARHRAAAALVIRELLLQRAAERDVGGAGEEERLANLIDLEVRVPEPTAEEVSRYYRRNGLKFMTPTLFEAAHIFFPARPDDDAARADAKARAGEVLEQVRADPSRFGELARIHSRCSSKDQGGSLGQIAKGDTNAELERALATMEEGTIAPAPVESRHGYHILRLDRRARGRQLALEEVGGRIEDHLRKCSKRRAIAQYLHLLAGSAAISGIDLAGAQSPLVQ